MFTILITISTLSALAYGLILTVRPPSLLRTVAKLLSVGSLALASYLSAGPVVLTLALLFGTFGDGFLSRSGDRNFLAGLASFLIGHICFIILFYQMVSGMDALTDDTMRMIIAVALAIIAFSVSINLSPYLGDLRLPVYAYVIVSLVMGICALMLPDTWPVLLVTIGAFLFISSDIILAYDLFVIPETSDLRRITSRLLWFLYWGGQLLILMGIIQAVP